MKMTWVVGPSDRSINERKAAFRTETQTKRTDIRNSVQNDKKVFLKCKNWNGSIQKLDNSFRPKWWVAAVWIICILIDRRTERRNTKHKHNKWSDRPKERKTIPDFWQASAITLSFSITHVCTNVQKDVRLHGSSRSKALVYNTPISMNEDYRPVCLRTLRNFHHAQCASRLKI